MSKVVLSLVLPCYNESEHFDSSMERILFVLKNSGYSFEIILVEDKSRDNTRDVVRKFIRKHKQYTDAIFHEKNMGRGKTVSDGILKAKGTYVGYMDIDCEVSPVYIPKFVKALEEGNDVVCGDRRYRLSVWSLNRMVVSRVYSFLVRLLLRSPLRDTEAGYKFFKRESILSILHEVADAGWFWDTEIVIRSSLANLRISSIPVLFVRRNDKTSTVNLFPDTYNYLRKLIMFRIKLSRVNLTC